MSGRFRVGAALAGVVVLTAGGLVAANWATAETRTKPTGQKSDPVGKVTERSPAVAEALEEHLESDSGVVGSYYELRR